MSLPNLAAFLRKLPTAANETPFRVQQLARGLVGGAVGAGAGYLASEDDDYTPMAYGAAMGAGLGALTTHRIPVQRAASTAYGLAQDIAQDLPPAVVPGSFKDRGLEAIAYDRQRWAAIPGMPQTAIDTSDVALGGGLGYADALLAEPKRLAGDLLEQGEGPALAEHMRINTGLRSWEHLQSRLSDYQAATHAARLRGDTGEAERLKGLYQDLQDRLTEHKVAFNDATVDELRGLRDQQAAALGPDVYGRVQAAATSFYDAHATMRDQLYTEGLIDEATRNRWAVEHAVTPYSPGSRLAAEQGADGTYSALANVKRTRSELQRRGISVKSLDNIIQRMEGSDAPLKDPVMGSLFHIQESRANIERNKAAKALIEGGLGVAGADHVVPGSDFYVRPLAEGETVRGDQGVVSYFEGGARRDFVVPGEYADVLNVAHADDVHRGLGVLSKVQRRVGAGLTGSNLAFAFANVPKDVLETMVYTPVWKDPLTFGKTWGKAFMEVIREDLQHGTQGPLRQAAREAGVGHATYTRNLQEMPSFSRLLADQQGPAHKTLQWFQNALNATEEATKIATHHTLTGLADRTGQTPLEIAAMTRRFGGSPDFARKGTLAPTLGPLYQFFNPVVQGLHRFYEKGATDPKWLLKSMGALSVGFFALDSYNQQFTDPETGRPLLEQVDPEVRRNNIVFLTGGTEVTSQGHVAPQYVRIPLGHVGVALLSPVIDALRMAHGEDLSAAQMAADVVSPLLPLNGTFDPAHPVSSILTKTLASVNPVLRYPLEEASNQTYFNDAPIVGRRLEKLEPSAQYTDTTSPTMVTLAHLAGQIPGLSQMPWLTSPQRLEHGYRTFFPGVWEMPLTALDARQPTVARGDYESAGKMPVLGPILRRFLPTGQDALRDQDAERFYGALQRDDEAASTYRAQPTVADRQAYLADHRQEILGARALAPVARAVGRLGVRRRQILADERLSPQDRQDQLQALYRQQTALLSRGNAMILQLDRGVQ